MIKKFFSILIISIILFSLAGFVFAQGRQLEIEYPEIEGEQPEQVTTPVPEYFKYVFNFLIWISGLIALIVLIYAGFQYFTSAGSPERINDAKSRISAALLGILILFGSYLILITINPDLIVFRLPRLKPIISELTPGVLVCKEGVEVNRAWQLANNFKHAKEYWEQEMIAEELEEIIEDISDKCCMITTAGNIRADLDNNITDIYFIPGIELKGGHAYLTLYGAILYEERGFQGYTLACYDHLESLPGGVYTPVHRDLTSGPFKISEPSSIEPFKLIWEPDPSWSIWLFQKPNYNKGTDLTGQKYTLSAPNWYGWTDLNALTDESGAPVSPESIWVEGDILGVLFTTPDRRGDSFSESDHNLLDNENIIDWEWCPAWLNPLEQCSVAAAKRLLIINALLY